MATGDRDALQLVSDQTYVELVTTRMGQTTTQEMDPAAFREKYGFAPAQMVDLKALMGDASDNVPRGARGGEKTAPGPPPGQRHLGGEVYARLDQETLETRPVMKKRLAEGRESAFLSYDLCTIRRDAPLDFTPEETLRKPANTALLLELFQKLDFKNSSPRWGWRPRAPARPTSPPTPQEVVWVRGGRPGPGPAGPVAGADGGGAGPARPHRPGSVLGEKGTRWPSSKRPPCRGTRPSWRACWALASPSWGTTART